MADDPISQFALALKSNDDTTTLSLIASNHVTATTLSSSKTPLLFLAISASCEPVVRAFLDAGADPNLAHTSDGQILTAAGAAISGASLQILTLLQARGAHTSCVMSVGALRLSAIDWAINMRHAACLAHLLGDARPAVLSHNSVAALCAIAPFGADARPCFDVLWARGFDFKALEVLAFSPDGVLGAKGDVGGKAVTDILLSAAHGCEDGELMMFFVKDVGLSLLCSEVGNEALAESAAGGEAEADGAASAGSGGEGTGRRRKKPGIEVRYI